VQSRNIEYIQKLDHLRFLAAVIVLIFHAKVFYHFPGVKWIPILDQGYVGVSLFMVLSGFILTLITLGKDISVSSFYTNRVLRIYPLFIFVVTAGYFSTPEPRETAVNVDFMMSLLPFSNLARLKYGPFGGQLWSVMVEMQFYLLFPLLAFMLKVRGVTFYLFTILLMLIVRLSVFFLNGSIQEMAYFSIFGNIDIFLIGCMVGLVYQSIGNGVMPHYIWISAFIGMNIMLAGLNHFGFSNSSMFWVLWPDVQGLIWAALIIAYLRSGRIVLSGVWTYFGKISYSLYAWHILVWMVVVRFLPTPVISPYVTGALIVLPLTVMLSALSFYVIETPFLLLRSRYILTKSISSM
jgi:peptidoglycan/LPS O-acetylase OafA/YrhL